ncbi:sialin-like [Saccostrea echinata]|uniref:sialin-like n=1 Tax=Saccostrea echinata TaxID=191078 RepID=UPI002A7F276E|nr:sialin-like [Saccostrea echinata]
MGTSEKSDSSVLNDGTLITNTTTDLKDCDDSVELKPNPTSEQEKLKWKNNDFANRTVFPNVRSTRNRGSEERHFIRSRKSKKPGSDTILRTFRRMRSVNMCYPHHNSTASDFMEQLQSLPYKDAHKVPWWTSWRVRFSGLCFVGFFFLYAQRVNLSIAIVCMIKTELAEANTKYQSNFTNMSTYRTLLNNSTIKYQQGYLNQSSHASEIPHSVPKLCPDPLLSEHMEGEFIWDKALQGAILGAFFWGYTAMQIPSGVLSERFGPRLVIFAGMSLVSVLTILTPVLARGSPNLLIITRVFIGIGEATMYPGAQAFWAKWSPPHERSRLVGFAFGGTQLGNALAFPVSSLFCEYVGWPWIFYFLGSCSLLWTLFWGFFVRDSPGEMPNITEIEKKYIEHSLGKQNLPENPYLRKKGKPWKSILTSLPVWAILVTNAAGNYGAYMLLTQIPTYLKEVLKFNIKSNGIYSMIPYLAFWMMIIVAGIFADTLISRQILSIKWTRKLCCAIGHFVPAAFLIALGYMKCFQQEAAVFLLTLSLAFCGFQFPSVFVNHGDIAPNYAGTIFGFTNTGASIPGIIAPYLVPSVTVNKTQQGWLVAFYIAAVIYCLGAIFFLIFSDGEVQEWAKDKEEMENLENITGPRKAAAQENNDALRH